MLGRTTLLWGVVAARDAVVMYGNKTPGPETSAALNSLWACQAGYDFLYYLGTEERGSLAAIADAFTQYDRVVFINDEVFFKASGDFRIPSIDALIDDYSSESKDCTLWMPPDDPALQIWRNTPTAWSLLRRWWRSGQVESCVLDKLHSTLRKQWDIMPAVHANDPDLRGKKIYSSLRGAPESARLSCPPVTPRSFNASLAAHRLLDTNIPLSTTTTTTGPLSSSSSMMRDSGGGYDNTILSFPTTTTTRFQFVNTLVYHSQRWVSPLSRLMETA